VLIALAGGIALLLALAAFAATPVGRGATGSTVAHGACCVIALGLVLVGAAALAQQGAPEALVLPFGPVHGRAALALDGLSAWFLLPLGIAAASAALDAAAAPSPRSGGPAATPLLLAGLVLCLAGADGMVMLCGLGVVLLVAGRTGAATGGAAAGLLAVGAALGLAGGAAAGFDTLRALPPEGWRAAALPFLGLCGAAALAAVAPLAGGRLAGRAEGPFLTAALPLAAVYILVRLLPDLGGPAQPSWWGVPLIAAGGAGAVAAALRAAVVDEAEAVPAAAGASVAGLAAMALGTALVFRGADLGALAALAAGGALLLATAGGLAVSALALATAAVARSAGTGRLDRLGGLARFMPVAAAAALLAAMSLAFLPPLPGFAGGWALLQALVAGWRLGGVALPMCCVLALLPAGAAAAILAAAGLRLFGAAFLGRPRTPRGAGAQDVSGAGLAALLLAVVPLVLLGLLPGWALAGGRAALAVFAGPAPLPTRGAGLALAEGGAAYAPLLLAALLALFAAALGALVARLATAGNAAPGSSWDGGFIVPPPHLPFGEPLTQSSAAGLAEPLQRLLGGLARDGAPRSRASGGRAGVPAFRGPGAATAAALCVLAAVLAVLALGGAG
jgi:hydrogenase-4 component B